MEKTGCKLSKNVSFSLLADPWIDWYSARSRRNNNSGNNSWIRVCGKHHMDVPIMIKMLKVMGIFQKVLVKC